MRFEKVANMKCKILRKSNNKKILKTSKTLKRLFFDTWRSNEKIKFVRGQFWRF